MSNKRRMKKELILRSAAYLEDKFLDDALITIRDGRLVSVRMDPGRVSPESYIRLAPEVVLVPSLIDAHVHIRGMGDVKEARRFGVYGLRDSGSRNKTGLDIRKTTDDLRSCGAAISPSKGYGGFLGVKVDDIREAREVIRRLCDRGADYIKVIASGLVSLHEYGHVSPGGFDTETLSAIVAVAREHGLKVSAHVNGDAAIKGAVTAGVASVEHGFYGSRGALSMMKDSGAFWVPTIYALASRIAGKEGDKEHNVEQSILELIIHDQKELLLHAAHMDLPIALGTDAGSPGLSFGSSLINEARIWLEAGLAPKTVLRGATYGAAMLSGLHSLLHVREGEPVNLAAVRIGGTSHVSATPIFYRGEGPATMEEIYKSIGSGR